MNYYQILEITQDASDEVIKAAYKALVKKYHPDANHVSDSDCNKNISRINMAYDVLSDKEKRKRYDQQIKEEMYNSQSYDQKSEKDNEETESYGSSFRTAYEKDNKNVHRESYSEKSESKSKVGNFFRSLGKEFVNTMQQNTLERDNAYLSGLSMDEYTLVQRFKHASGFKRIGYAKALEEKGLLQVNSEGKYIPTQKFKEYFQ